MSRNLWWGRYSRQLESQVQRFGRVKEHFAFREVRSSIRLEIVRELTGVETEKNKNFSSHDLESPGHEKRRH